MLQKSAILYIEKIKCTKTTGEAGHDSVRLEVVVDGSTSYYPSQNSTYTFYKDGGTQNVDIAINVTYANSVVFKLREIDTGSGNDFIGSHTLTRGSTSTSPESRTVDMDANGNTSGEYELTYRIISDPIPTLRVLGIRCEQQSAGCNVDLVEAIAGVASTVTEEAAKVIKKSPRPRAKAIAGAFKAASKVLNAVSYIGEWIGRIIEGTHDEVYMKHVESSRGYQGAFFPPDKEYEEMQEGDEICFEERYGHYFRFPLDRGPVTLRFMEHDNIKGHIDIGTLTIAPDSLTPGSGSGISGTTVNGGVAVMDGPAVVELANVYTDNHGGEGALYHICYSVGFDDWCLPATAAEQGGGVIPVAGKTYSIIAKHSGKAISVHGASQEDGANVDQWELVDVTNQLFTLQDRGYGYYSLAAKHSGKVISVYGASHEDGANIIQWHFVQGEDHQLFRLQDKGNGYYAIIAKHSGKAISVHGESQEDGGNIDQWHLVDGQNNQLFAFFPG